MNKPVIAIDGPAASGKGTLSRALADHLTYAHMDTGALYRAVGLQMLQSKLAPQDAAQNFADTFTPDQLDSPLLRTNEVAQNASKAAAIPEVRSILLDLQRSFAANPGDAYQGAVLDGRDIGTIIAPNASAKLFITARIDARAKRRTKELQLNGQTVTYEAVLKDMRERDARDTDRESAPMIPADNAMILDTSDLDQEQVFEKAMLFIKTKI